MSVAFRMIVLLRVIGAMYVNINDCDEGTRSRYSAQFSGDLTYISSVQFLGAIALPRPRTCISNLGSIPRVCNPQLGIYLAALHSRKTPNASAWSGKGMAL